MLITDQVAIAPCTDCVQARRPTLAKPNFSGDAFQRTCPEFSEFQILWIDHKTGCLQGYYAQDRLAVIRAKYYTSGNYCTHEFHFGIPILPFDKLPVGQFINIFANWLNADFFEVIAWG